MLLYYLREADGTPMADRWIGYRELPGGSFYSQAFQGYSGDRLARTFGERPEAYVEAAHLLDGIPLTALPGVAFAFLPLPLIRLAAILYPGDEEFAARAFGVVRYGCQPLYDHGWAGIAGGRVGGEADPGWKSKPLNHRDGFRASQ